LQKELVAFITVLDNNLPKKGYRKVITGKQIKAARVLIDMGQEELATLTGLTSHGIRKIEDGTSTPQKGTVSDILRVFAERRIEFTDGQGVRFRDESTEVLNGKDGMKVFWDRVFTFAQTIGGVIRQNGIPEGPLDQCAPEEAAAHRERMQPLINRRRDIYVRAILEEGDMNFLCTAYADYKWNPKEAPPTVPYYIFGDSIAIFAFEAEPSPKIILITSLIIANAYIKQFDRAWEIAKIPPRSNG
jgi:DNA-binding XRE family transcriptional regulator